MIIIIIIILESWPSSKDSARFDPVFTSLDFGTIILLQNKIVSLASNPHPGGPGLCVYVSQ
jgi:hypothetical protein